MLGRSDAVGLLLQSSLLFAACGGNTLSDEFADPDATPPPVVPKDAQAPEEPGDDDPLDAGADAGGSPIDRGEAPEDCPAFARGVYVIDRDLVLWEFEGNAGAPAESTLRKVGTLACPGAARDALPRALAVARSGRALVEFGDYAQTSWSEQIFTIDLATGACHVTSYEAGDALVPAPFGMAFVGAQGNETLLVASQSEDPYRLSMLDPVNLEGAGLRAGASGEAQLAGTAGEVLYGLYAAPTPHIAEVNWGTGASDTSYELTAEPVALGAHTAFALAAQGDDSLWAFFLRDDQATTQVVHVATTSGKVSSFILDEHAILAAGSSTCLP